MLACGSPAPEATPTPWYAFDSPNTAWLRAVVAEHGCPDVAAARGKPQEYGTQSRLENGRLVLKPIRDSANVDARRARMGLPSLREYMRVMDSVYLGATPAGPPTRRPQ